MEDRPASMQNRFIKHLVLAAAFVVSGLNVHAAASAVFINEKPSALTPVAGKVGGRVLESTLDNASATYQFQWPGIYFECAFEGQRIYFSIGPSHVIYNITVDGAARAPLVNPKPGLYSVAELENGPHVVRLEAVTESQSAPNSFFGFYIDRETRSMTAPVERRQIEFIGDSHTVGYGNTSTTRACTPDEVWATTNTSLSFPVLIAKHYHAEYQVNAYSGRGIVRNYNGFRASSLPDLYPYILFDKDHRVDLPNWQPRVIVINLGTNDFSTPLNAGEKWKTRKDLQSDYVETYVKFVRELRRQHPKALIILAANDQASGEIQNQVRQVYQNLKAAGETDVGFVPLSPMKLTGCDWHPSLEDDQGMMADLVTFIDQRLGQNW